MKKQEKRGHGRVLTLNHNENSNKNININISYNLGHPNSSYHRRLHTENYNPNNSLTSNDPRSTTGIKGKKIDNREVDYPFQQDRLLHNSLSKESNMHSKMRTEEAEQECEISIKVIKKKKPPLAIESNKPTGNKIVKNKTSGSMRMKKRLYTEEAPTGPSTTTNKQSVGCKNFFSTHEHISKNTDFQQLTKLYKENRRKSRSCSKEHSESKKRLKSADRKKTIEENHDAFEDMMRKIKKQADSKESIAKKDSSILRPKKLKGDRVNKSELFCFKKDKKKMGKSKSLEKVPRKKKVGFYPEERLSLMNPPARRSLERMRNKTISEYQPRQDIEPFITRVMNSSLMSDSLKMSELTSKELSDRRQLELMEETLTLNRNSIELTSGARQMREMERISRLQVLSRIAEESSAFSNPSQTQIPALHKAASLIKHHWHEYKRKKIIQYYSSLFQRNQSTYFQEQVSDIFAEQNEDDGEYANVAEYHNNSFENDEECDSDQEFGTPFNARNRPEPSGHKQLALDLKSEQFVKAASGVDINEEQREIIDQANELAVPADRTEEEEQSQFDVNKYQGLVQRSIEGERISAQKSCSLEIPRQTRSKEEPQPPSSSDKQDIHRFKQQQLEQWNHINQLINRQLNQNQMDPHVLLQELMKQSELNKKWIEESCEASLRNQRSGGSPHNSRAQSRSSQRSENYRNLFEEKGIVDRLKRNSQNIKQLLCNTYEIDKSEKSISRRSNSLSNLQEKEQKSEKVSKSGNSSKIEDLMTYEMMNDEDSDEGQIAFNRPKKREKSQLIDQFLDCGLNECGFEDLPYLPVGQQQDSNQLHSWEDEELRRRSRNMPISNENVHLREQILSPKALSKPPTLEQYESEQQQYTNEILVKITNSEEPRSILINQDSMPQSFDEEDYGNNEPISKLFQQQRFSKHGIFESIYHMLLEEFCFEIEQKQKFERDFFNCFSSNKLRNRERGIKTSNASVKAYLVNFVDYLLTHPDQRTIVLRNVNTKLGPTSAQMLYYLRLQDSYTQSESEESEEETVIIIPYDTFQRFESYLDKQQPEDSQRRNSKIQNYTFNWHRAIFECMNEAMDEQRPYGTHGQPYAWEVEPRIKNTSITEKTLQNHLELAASKVLETVSFMGGILFDKDDSPYSPMLAEQHKLQINEDRLSRILATQLYEGEQSWIYYNEEKLEVNLDLYNLVIERMMFEMANELNKIRRRRVFLPDSLIASTS